MIDTPRALRRAGFHEQLLGRRRLARVHVRDDADGAVVDLEMSYEPVGLLATLAAPVLVVDNFLALNVLLQSAVRRRRP